MKKQRVRANNYSLSARKCVLEEMYFILQKRHKNPELTNGDYLYFGFSCILWLQSYTSCEQSYALFFPILAKPAFLRLVS